MPHVRLHAQGQVIDAEVPSNTNLVVQAGIRRFPYPQLRYGCGMGKCAKCACRVLQGAGDLPPPNWKERRQLGANLDAGYRLMCQIWLHTDVELAQDATPLTPAADAAEPAPSSTAPAPGPAA
jgi:ferredoxin